MSGTATMPLMTAPQNSARMGLIGEYCRASATSTLTVMMP